MIRRPPSPPLFPYTTLFRSEVDQHPAVGARESGDRVPATAYRDFEAIRAREVYAVDDVRGACALQDQPDRKSTRLNSSHSQISYAVFCLKKKKKHCHVLVSN